MAANVRILSALSVLGVLQLGYLAWAVSAADGGWLVLGGGVLIALVAGVVAAVILSNGSRSDDSVAVFLEELVAGKRRLDQRLEGEASASAVAVNQTMAHFQEVFERVSGNLDRIKVMSRELSKHSAGGSTHYEREIQEVQEAIASMSAAVHDASQNAATAAQAARGAANGPRGSPSRSGRR